MLLLVVGVMKMSENTEVIETVKHLIETRYPNVPENLILEILKIESENTDDQAIAQQKVNTVLEDYLRGI